MSNLASNALKYSVDAHIEIAVRREGSEVAVIVRDAGIGIPADEISTVFDRFARASNARNSKIRGTGLGLYFVKQLVDRIGGTIAIASEVGIGTAVTVKLPLATLSPVDVPVVLSIESAGDERSLVASELRGVGYQVRVAQSIAGAEVVMRHERVCLVIADLDLFDPGNLDELRDASAQRSLPMLTIGSHCEDAAPDQLRKPFVAEDLLRKVDAIVPVASLAS
jgi:hypothetical protein